MFALRLTCSHKCKLAGATANSLLADTSVVWTPQ